MFTYKCKTVALYLKIVTTLLLTRPFGNINELYTSCFVTQLGVSSHKIVSLETRDVTDCVVEFNHQTTPQTSKNEC